MNAKLKSAIERSIGSATGLTFQIKREELCGGGCINDAIIFHGETESFFVKLNTADKLEMFAAEAAGLEAIKRTNTVYVPTPIVHGRFADTAYLVLEPLEFSNSGDWQMMGQLLAQLHRQTANCFGWERDNTIGSTPQQNLWTDDWLTFFREHRLRFQFELARKNGYRFELEDRLLNSVDAILSEHTPEPSLLHGDLWSGNAGFLASGQPVIYDPACYYGDRETDLAFSEFFGGFPADFYRSYNDEWPLNEGYEKRKILYNLYHVLNHANLFGSSYANQAQQMIQQLTNS